MDELNEAQVEFDEYYKGLGKAKLMLSMQPTIHIENKKDDRGDYHTSNNVYERV